MSPGPRPRTPLDRARVLATAVARADADGLDAISMRSLSAELGVVPMALYKHVANKDDLRSGMIDAVIAEYRSPPASLAWQPTVRARILAARTAALEHPWLRQAIESATARTPAVLGHMNAVAGDLIDGGISVDLTHYALHALGHRIWGYTSEAFSGADNRADEDASDEDRAIAMQHAATHFPHVVAIAVDAATRNPGGACDDQGEFEFTLDLLLDAVARLHASRWTSSPLPGGV